MSFFPSAPPFLCGRSERLKHSKVKHFFNFLEKHWWHQQRCFQRAVDRCVVVSTSGRSVRTGSGVGCLSVLGPVQYVAQNHNKKRKAFLCICVLCLFVSCTYILLAPCLIAGIVMGGPLLLSSASSKQSMRERTLRLMLTVFKKMPYRQGPLVLWICFNTFRPYISLIWKLLSVHIM